MSEEVSGHTVSFKFGDKYDAPWDVIRGASAEELRALLVEFAGYDSAGVAEVPLVDLIAMEAVTAQASYAAAKGLGAKPVALERTAPAAKAASKPASKPAAKPAVKPASAAASTTASVPASTPASTPAASSAFAAARADVPAEAAPAAPQTAEIPPFETDGFDMGAWLIERLAEVTDKSQIATLYKEHQPHWGLPGVKEAVQAAAARVG